VLFGLLVPHGLLELTAVFLAGAVGMRLGWSVIAPGDRPRGQVLAEQGRAVASVALGLVAVLLVSGLVEAMVTPSGLPTWARIAIGGPCGPPSWATSCTSDGGRACRGDRRHRRRARRGAHSLTSRSHHRVGGSSTRAGRRPSSPDTCRPVRGQFGRPGVHHLDAEVPQPGCQVRRSLRARSAAAAPYTVAASERPADISSTRGSDTAAMIT
jgi:hypothetical protein